MASRVGDLESDNVSHGSIHCVVAVVSSSKAEALEMQLHQTYSEEWPL